MSQRARPSGEFEHEPGTCGACDQRRAREAEMEATRAWFEMKARLAPKRSNTCLNESGWAALDAFREMTTKPRTGG